MRLATFNIESLDAGPHVEVPFETRAAVLRPILERLQADVLCLQEVNGQHVAGTPERQLLALDRLLGGTSYEAFARVATSGASGRGVAGLHNLVMLSRYAVRRHRDVRHDYVRVHLDRLDGADAPRIAAALAELEREASATLGREGFEGSGVEMLHALDLRYIGQQWDIRVPVGRIAASSWTSTFCGFGVSYHSP